MNSQLSRFKKYLHNVPSRQAMTVGLIYDRTERKKQEDDVVLYVAPSAAPAPELLREPR